MLKNIIKKITNFRNKQDLDGKFWIQKALLSKNFQNNHLGYDIINKLY